ncbi:hypothetical protein BGW80DRAFT_1348822 [Lactifluus volemus]|nr:hypothetical protein BGW80DRAFT_1348822 [Lactifluus volemus]
MDTSVPHHHDPTPHILDRPRFASSQKTPHSNPTRATPASLRMAGTLDWIHTGFTSFHTPASSFSDDGAYF